MITRKEYIRHRLLELSKELRFQTFELYFPNPLDNTIEREFFIIKPAGRVERHISLNTAYNVLELEIKVVGRNRIINTYPVTDFSLTKEALFSMEMIIVHDFNEVDVSEYSYQHKAAYEDEYKDFLIDDGEKPRLKSNIIIPIVERKSHGIFTVMNKYRRIQDTLVFDDIADEDISIVMEFASDLSRDLTYKFGFRKTLIPSIGLNSAEEKLYSEIKSDPDVVGKSVAFQNILKRIAKICFSSEPVLMLGSTGVGKTYFAKLIYKYWQCNPVFKYKIKWDQGREDIKVMKIRYGGKERIKKQFRNINIAAIPDTLFESEIFGSVKGAATDIKGRLGVLVEESGYPLVILFDEIGDLSPMSQAKLLKCIEEQEISLVGSNIQIPLNNVLIIAATNKSDILTNDESKTLRNDLIYRFKDIIYIPPLHQRVDDIEMLITHYLKKYNQEIALDDTTLEILRNYSYPGNIRELESIVLSGISRLKTGEKTICYYHLPRTVLESAEYEGLFSDVEKMYNYHDGVANQDAADLLRDLKNDYEIKRRNIIENYYFMTNKNIAQTAKRTGLSEAHVRRLLKSNNEGNGIP